MKENFLHQFDRNAWGEKKKKKARVSIKIQLQNFLPLEMTRHVDIFHCLSHLTLADDK